MVLDELCCEQDGALISEGRQVGAEECLREPRWVEVCRREHAPTRAHNLALLSSRIELRTLAALPRGWCGRKEGLGRWGWRKARRSWRRGWLWEWRWAANGGTHGDLACGECGRALEGAASVQEAQKRRHEAALGGIQRRWRQRGGRRKYADARLPYARAGCPKSSPARAISMRCWSHFSLTSEASSGWEER